MTLPQLALASTEIRGPRPPGQALAHPAANPAGSPAAECAKGAMVVRAH